MAPSMASPASIIGGLQQGAAGFSQQFGASAVSAGIASANGGAAAWQLVVAFACGGLFVTGLIGALTIAYTMGASNVDRAKAMVSLVVRRTVRTASRAPAPITACRRCMPPVRLHLEDPPRHPLAVVHSGDDAWRGEHGLAATTHPGRPMCE